MAARMTYYYTLMKMYNNSILLKQNKYIFTNRNQARSMEGKHVVFVQHQNELRKKGFLYVLSILIENEK